jgi:hypothetical protein
MVALGDKSRFAVEYELDMSFGGEWMFGRFCYWCGGQAVGDYGLGTSLRDVLFGLDQILKYADRRAATRFEGMSAPDVFRTLYAAFFGPEESSADSAVINEEEWARHAIVPAVDVFDHWKGFLVENGVTGRLVVGHLPTDRIHETVLRSGECDEVLRLAQRHLDEIHEREVGRKEPQ